VSCELHWGDGEVVSQWEAWGWEEGQEFLAEKELWSEQERGRERETKEAQWWGEENQQQWLLAVREWLREQRMGRLIRGLGEELWQGKEQRREERLGFLGERLRGQMLGSPSRWLREDRQQQDWQGKERWRVQWMEAQRELLRDSRRERRRASWLE
jgi:hypothetical protein